MLDDLFEFLQEGVTPYHAAATAAAWLDAAGFTRLEEADYWNLEPGKGYYILRNGSAVAGTAVQQYESNHSDAQLWKIVYENGEEVSREVFNTSHYEKSDQIIEVGTASASGDVLKALQDAIASQDQAKINAAVSQAASAGGQSQEQTQTEG